MEAKNSCVFDGPRWSETDLYFLGLSCGNRMPGDWWRGVLLRQLYEDCGFAMYERVGIGRSRDSLGHNIESVVCLI